jgi:hypothetical protein
LQVSFAAAVRRHCDALAPECTNLFRTRIQRLRRSTHNRDVSAGSRECKCHLACENPAATNNDSDLTFERKQLLNKQTSTYHPTMEASFFSAGSSFWGFVRTGLNKSPTSRKRSIALRIVKS